MTRTGAVALLCGLSLVAVGCGTRVSPDAGLSATSASAAGGGSVTTAFGAGPPLDRGEAGATGAVQVEPAPATPVPALGGSAPVASKPTAASSAPVGGRDVPSRPEGAGHGPGAATLPAPGPDRSPATPGAPAAPPPGAAAKSVVKIGSVGTHSGPVGGVLRGAIEALQVWQRFVNDRGGLNGHPVRILFVDDGGESARHLAAMKTLVEREKVIAFVQDSAPLGNGR